MDLYNKNYMYRLYTSKSDLEQNEFHWYNIWSINIQSLILKQTFPVEIEVHV